MLEREWGSGVLARFAQVSEGLVGAGSLFVEGLVVEAGLRWSDAVLLAHLEVLAEVLVTTPPVQVDHTQTLVTSNLMEVRVPHVVLDAVHGESSVAVQLAVSGVGLTNSVAPVLDHLLLLVLDHNVEEEAAPAVEDNHAPHEADAVHLMEGLELPVGVAEGVFEEASNVLEGSPSLGLVTGLLGGVDKLAEVAIGVLGQRSILHSQNHTCHSLLILTQSV